MKALETERNNYKLENSNYKKDQRRLQLLSN